MGIEIERKFLVRDDGWRRDIVDEVPIMQGYFARTPLLRARIRLYGDKAYITIKSQPGPRARLEFEYEIPRADAEEIIEQFSIEPLISKVRHQVRHRDTLWSVDVFNGANHGLIVAEVELETVDQAVVLPSWVGEEVTSDIRYGNSNLARFPFVSWPSDQGRGIAAGP